MIVHYVLDGKEPVEEPDVLRWAEWFEGADDERQVALTVLDTGEEISTVFLGLDHNFLRKGPPVLFETMVFGGELDGEQRHYATWEEAEEGHKAMVREVENV